MQRQFYHCTTTADDKNVNDFARAFGHVQMPAALQREAEEFSAQAQRTAEARRQETGDVGGNDEDHIFINQGSATRTQMIPNHGQSNFYFPRRIGKSSENDKC